MSKKFKMKVDMTNYSYIIHIIYAVISFLVDMFNLQYYSVYVLCVSDLCYMSDCCQWAAVIPYILQKRAKDSRVFYRTVDDLNVNDEKYMVRAQMVHNCRDWAILLYQGFKTFQLNRKLYLHTN